MFCSGCKEMGAGEKARPNLGKCLGFSGSPNSADSQPRTRPDNSIGIMGVSSKGCYVEKVGETGDREHWQAGIGNRVGSRCNHSPVRLEPHQPQLAGRSESH